MLVWPPKDADEVIEYMIDWTDRLLGDRISSASFSVVSGGVTLSGSAHDSVGVSLVTVTGGTNGTKAKVLCEIDTDDGQSFQQTATILVRAR